MKITELLDNKRILLWGYGLEGKSTEKFINKYCKVKELTVFQGKREEIDEDAYDYIIKSPGIVAWDLSDKFTSMTELFLTQFSGQVIGVTGTKGKSTTSSLLYSVLREPRPLCSTASCASAQTGRPFSWATSAFPLSTTTVRSQTTRSSSSRCPATSSPMPKYRPTSLSS